MTSFISIVPTLPGRTFVSAFALSSPLLDKTWVINCQTQGDQDNLFAYLDQVGIWAELETKSEAEGFTFSGLESLVWEFLDEVTSELTATHDPSVFFSPNWKRLNPWNFRLEGVLDNMVVNFLSNSDPQEWIRNNLLILKRKDEAPEEPHEVLSASKDRAD